MINYITVPVVHVCSCSSVRRWMQSTHISYAQKMRRLSKGRSLARVSEVQEMLWGFLAAPFSDTEETANLAYLCDIHNLLNELNLSITLGEKDNCV